MKNLAKILELTIKEIDAKIEAIQNDAQKLIDEIQRLNQNLLLLSGKQQALIELKSEAEAAKPAPKKKKEE